MTRVMGLVIIIIISTTTTAAAAASVRAALEDMEKLNEIGDCESWQTVFVKECVIIMKKIVKPVKVRRCEPQKEHCSGGVRKKCSIM